MTHEITAGRHKGRQCAIVKRNGSTVLVLLTDGKQAWVRATALRPADDRQSRYAQDRVAG